MPRDLIHPSFASQSRTQITAGSVSDPDENFSSNTDEAWQKCSYLLLLLSQVFGFVSHSRLAQPRDIWGEFSAEVSFQTFWGVTCRVSSGKSCSQTVRHTALACGPLLLLVPQESVVLCFRKNSMVVWWCLILPHEIHTTLPKVPIAQSSSPLPICL